MNAEALNLATIDASFLASNQGGRRALNLFRDRANLNNPDGLGSILRQFERNTIADETVRNRDAFDDLLGGYYGMLEVSSLCGMIPEKLPPKMVDEAHETLRQANVRHFLGNVHSFPLVDAFQLRLDGNPIAPWGAFQNSYHRFDQFYDLVKTNDRADLNLFVQFLDYRLFPIGDRRVGIDDLLKAIEDPRFLARSFSPENDRDLMSRAVRGMVEFIDLCGQFDPFLQSLTDKKSAIPNNPLLLQSVYWHFHADWFINLRESINENILKRVFKIVAEWKVDEADRAPINPDDEKAMEASIQKSLDSIGVSIDRLIGENYKTPLAQRM